MPALMRSHHLIVGKAGGATVQEAIAAGCPMIVNQIIPGQEAGNARLIEELELGAVAETARQVADAVDHAFGRYARVWSEWRDHTQALSKPKAALRIAELLLAGEAPSQPSSGSLPLFQVPRLPNPQPKPARDLPGQMLLCDFHIHTNYSDGKLTLPEVVDFYGELGFDCICITDHLADPERLIGRMSRLCNFTLGPEQLDEYFEVIAQERRRAWQKYGMLVLAGLEFNKDGYTSKSSAHLLAIDLKFPVDPALDLPDLIVRIQQQGALAVASHPHIMQSEWGKNTLHLWNNQEQFAPLLDAWEIANRENIFNPVGLKRLPFIANSDFHKPKHIYSWKTLLRCAKDPEAIKRCIRANRDVAITLFRKESVQERQEASPRSDQARTSLALPLPRTSSAFN
jgi:hypothetical protein